ncbi:MAG: NAD(P)-dependent oxidoreductase [Chloroflexota bacterium]
MRYLVTGGGGFVGSYLVEMLLKKNIEVRVLDKVVGELERLKNRPGLELVIGGTEDPGVVDAVMKDVDVVYHLAWAFPAKPADAFKIDVGGYINVLESAVAHKVRHFIFPSSSVVYGEPAYSPLDESHPYLVEKSRDPLHALTKLAVHKLSSLYFAQYKLPCTIFIFWWGYGAEHIPGRNLRNLIDSALKGETIKAPQRACGSATYLGDIAKAFELATLNDKSYGQEFNLASFTMKWREIMELIVKLTNSESKIEVVPDEKWDGPGFFTGNWELSTKKAQELIGYKPDPKTREVFTEALRRDIEARKKVLGIK